MKIKKKIIEAEATLIHNAGGRTVNVELEIISTYSGKNQYTLRFGQDIKIRKEDILHFVE